MYSDIFVFGLCMSDANSILYYKTITMFKILINYIFKFSLYFIFKNYMMEDLLLNYNLCSIVNL